MLPRVDMTFALAIDVYVPGIAPDLRFCFTFHGFLHSSHIPGTASDKENYPSFPALGVSSHFANNSMRNFKRSIACSPGHWNEGKDGRLG